MTEVDETQDWPTHCEACGTALQRGTMDMDKSNADHPVYRPGALRQGVQRYTLSGLHEDLPWQRDGMPIPEPWPPTDPAWRHVVINELSREVLESSTRTAAVRANRS